MTILSAQTITEYAIDQNMINPFTPEKVRSVGNVGIVSYGLGGSGYDIRLINEWKVCRSPSIECNAHNMILDVKEPMTWQHIFDTFRADECIIPPHSFALGASYERFRVPANVMGLAFGKSTYARLGINALVTPLEPGWEGYLTIEIANNSPFPGRIYAGEGIVQVVFVELDQYTSHPYHGRYQDQRSGVTMPSMEQ